MNKIVKYTSSVAGASLFLIFASSASRVVGFLREIIFASEFGLSKEFDIYLIASVIPITTNTIIYFIGQNFFIPYYKDSSEIDKFKSIQFLRTTLLSFSLGGAVIGVLYFLFAAIIISIFVDPAIAVNDDAILVFKIFAFTIPLASSVSILAAYSNRMKNFLPPALSSLGLNISVILFVVLLNNSIGVISIAVGYLIGLIGQLFYLFYSSEMKTLIYSKSKLANWDLKDLMSSSLIIIIIIESIGQFYGIADRFFFNSVSEGSLSALNYAQTLISLPISIIAVPLGTALFTKISEDLNDSSLIGFANSFKNSINVSCLIFIPIIFIFNFWGLDIISILLQRGEFDAIASAKTTGALRSLNIGLLFYAIYSIFNKVLYSAKLAKQLLIITLFGILIKIVFNFFLVTHFDFIGLALSTSFSYLFFFSASLFVIVKKFKFKWVLSSLYEFVILFCSAFFAMIISEVLVNNYVIDKFAIFILKILFFIIIYALNLKLTQNDGFNFILNRVLSRKTF